MKTLRVIPPVCLLISLGRLLSGKLRFSRSFLNQEVKSADDRQYIIFRHIMIHPQSMGSDTCVFVVSFRFAHLSHKANKLASLIPMLLIAGFPGFMQKIYAVDPESGYWSGMYQWRSENDLKAYQKSLVYRMMNKRAVKGSVTSLIMPYSSLNDYIKKQTIIQYQKQLNKKSKS